jgi:hypothetical protein
MKRSPVLPIAIILLLLPILYVSSYLALVVRQPMVAVSLTYPTQYSADFYRWGGDTAETFFYPLEQIDRRLQPHAWRNLSER